MGRNARLRKMRREARRLVNGYESERPFAQSYERNHPGELVFCSDAPEKMSQIIEDFAAPLLSAAESPEDFKKGLLFAMIAWNYSLLDDASRGQPTGPYAELLADPTARDVFESLLARKRLLYPDIRRAVLDFELIPNGTEFRFNVISTLDRR